MACQFADLHDTPERMHEKGCVTEIVAWRGARRYLYWRLRRLLHEHRATSAILSAQPQLGVGQAGQMLRRWFAEDRGTQQAYSWDNDNNVVAEWFAQQGGEDSTVSKNVLAVRKDATINCLKQSIEVSCIFITVDAGILFILSVKVLK